MEKKRVLVFGTFDLLHPGHLFYLEKAKSFGERLFVVVARDSTVEKVKGRKPINDESFRLKMVQALRAVDEAVLGAEGNIYLRIEEIRPHAICLGYDQKPSDEELSREMKKLGINAEIHRMESFHSEKLQAKKIKEKILERERLKEGK